MPVEVPVVVVVCANRISMETGNQALQPLLIKDLFSVASQFVSVANENITFPALSIIEPSWVTRHVNLRLMVRRFALALRGAASPARSRLARQSSSPDLLSSP